MQETSGKTAAKCVMKKLWHNISIIGANRHTIAVKTKSTAPCQSVAITIGSAVQRSTAVEKDCSDCTCCNPGAMNERNQIVKEM